MGSVICTLFVVDRFSFEAVTIRKCGDILSSVGGETLKPIVNQDAGVARCFDENVFKTKPEAKRSVSFIFAGYDRARRIDIVKAVRLRGRGITPENDESPQCEGELERVSANRLLTVRFHDLTNRPRRASLITASVEVKHILRLRTQNVCFWTKRTSWRPLNELSWGRT
jgi:hypothetical protein